jgi:prepilin peptidase CpaA
MTIMDALLEVILMMVLVIAVVTDLRSSRIPNWLTFPAMGFALAGHAWLNGIDGILFSLAGFGMGLGLFFFIYLAGGIGAGDVKLMASIGAFVGGYGVLSCAWLAMILGGIYAIGAMGYQWGVAAAGQRLVYAAYGAVMVGGSVWSRELALPFKLRYGLVIAAGTLLFQLGIHPFGG